MPRVLGVTDRIDNQPEFENILVNEALKTRVTFAYTRSVLFLTGLWFDKKLYIIGTVL